MRDFEHRRDAETTEIFLRVIKYFLRKCETERAVKVLNDMLSNIG
jgi:pentatricopeptide repeat protein